MRPETLWLILGLAVPAVLLMAYARMVHSRLVSALAGLLAGLITLAMVAIVVLAALGMLPAPAAVTEG
ncbi:hypothetical protein E1091_10265 [Micromonospora fluostatini]|uniref:Uncharacterized protein n=1 Tax=Micromonospora fluostatini TaxID=1629071 RepID=A0ABY2DH74_9ACTN|nr:hypothetical protein E1091_10265 [Micromonospora fluostatini]